MNHHLIQIQYTASSQQEAELIASALVEVKLAACVHITGPIKSVYRWKGNIEMDVEWSCSVKTRAELFDVVEQKIKELHSYDVPEIIAVPIVNGCKEYLQWVQEVTAQDSDK